MTDATEIEVVDLCDERAHVSKVPGDPPGLGCALEDDGHHWHYDVADDIAWKRGTPGERTATGALDPAKRPAAPDEPVSPSCNYEVVQDTRGKWVDVGADLGRVELDGHKLPLEAARELLDGLAASIRHCEWWLSENCGGDAAAAEAEPTREEIDRCGYSEDPFHSCPVCYDYAAGGYRPSRKTGAGRA